METQTSWTTNPLQGMSRLHLKPKNQLSSIAVWLLEIKFQLKNDPGIQSCGDLVHFRIIQILLNDVECANKKNKDVSL